MTRKLWLSTALVAVALLAVFAGSGAAKSAKAGAQGGTLNIDLPNDVDYTDPALDYLSTGWEIEYATCLKLMNYPDANGAKGSQLVPEAARGFPKVSNSGKTYDFNVQGRLHEVLERPGCHGRELQGCVRPQRGPEDAVAGCRRSSPTSSARASRRSPA